MTHDRKLGSEEIQRVLQRAGELQSQSWLGPAEGLSVEALEDLALQSGLDPALVRQALAEIDEGAARKRHWLLGEAPKLELSRRAVGDLDDAHLNGLVEEIEETLGTVGTTRRLGRGLIWAASHGIVSRVQGFIRGLRRSSGSDIPTVVRLSPEGEHTAVVVSEELRGDAGRIFSSWLLGLGMPSAALTLVLTLVGAVSGLTALAFWMVLLPTVFLCARSHFGSLVARRKEKLTDLLGRVVVHLEAGSSRPAQQDAEGEEQSLPTTRAQEESGAGSFEASRAVEVDGSRSKAEGRPRRRRSRS